MGRIVAFTTLCFLVAACGGEDSSSDGPGGTGFGGGFGAAGTGVGGTGSDTTGTGTGTGPSGPMYPELWYSVDRLLVLITLDGADGSVASVQSSTINIDLDSGQTAITMLNDGSLLASRLSK